VELVPAQSVVAPVAAGDLIAARWTGRRSYAAGQHLLPGATAPAGTPVEFSGHDRLRISGGWFAEYWVICETEHLTSQLTRTDRHIGAVAGPRSDRRPAA
jgi:hypothetical protein